MAVCTCVMTSTQHTTQGCEVHGSQTPPPSPKPPVTDAECRVVQAELEWLLSQESGGQLPGAVDDFTLRLLHERAAWHSTGQALAEMLNEHSTCDHWRPGDRRAVARWNALGEKEERRDG